MAIGDGLRPATMLDGSQAPDDLLDGDRVQIKQCFNGNCYLRQMVGDDLQHLADDVDVGDVVAEDTQVVGEASDADGEVLGRLGVLPDQRGDVSPELLGIGLTYTLDTNAYGLHCVPRRLRRTLALERCKHLGRNGTQDRRHRQTVVAVLDDVVFRRLDGVPNALGLHVHLHQHGPLLIVGAG